MEAFTLLKYRRASSTVLRLPPSSDSTTTTTTVPHSHTSHHHHNNHHYQQQQDDDDDDDDSESEFNITLSPEPNSKPQFTSSFFKSATKLSVFISGLTKPKSGIIKFKDEQVPNKFKQNRFKSQSNQNQNEKHEALSPLEEKRFSKEVVMQKYLKIVKPLYIRVSRRYNHGEKVEVESVTEGETVAESEENNANSQNQIQKQGNIPAGLRVVYKHLGKSSSASSAVEGLPAAKRHDDSLLQQQDGIQGAILHCKRSFNAFRV